jgi:MFS family permease
MIKKIKQIFTGDNDQLPLVLIFALVMFFWAVFDSVMQYIAPLIIQQQGFSNSMVGIIIGFSSVAGAAFDFFIYKIFKKANFRLMILAMFAICFAYPLLLWHTKSIWLFLFAMAVWGIYYDLYGFGVFNFVAKHIKRKNYASSFGVIQIFKSLGNIVAPLIIGLIVVTAVDWRSFAVGWISLSIGFVVFLYLIFILNKNKTQIAIDINKPKDRKNLFVELKLWGKLGTLLRPVLVMVFYYHIIDAFFWTLIPLYVLSMNDSQFGGIFLAAYSIPALIAGLFVGPVTKKYGKKRSAYASLLIGSLILSTFFLTTNPFALIVITFVASLFIKLTHPVMNSSISDYVNDAPQVEVEIEGLEDFSTNIGYIVGPIAAGIMADLFGMQATFGLIGVIGAILALSLLIFSPRRIMLKEQVSDL